MLQIVSTFMKFHSFWTATPILSQLGSGLPSELWALFFIQVVLFQILKIVFLIF
jgi:hypothetical protein